MNYNDQILENKAFNFFKQLMYNLAVAICIMLLGVLILVYGFKFQLYEVLSDSQAPYFTEYDLVVAKPKSDYEVGDIIKFNTTSGTPVTHRLIYIHEENGVKYYICHGDNVQSANPNAETHLVPWQEDYEYVKQYFNSGKTISDLDTDISDRPREIQVTTIGYIDGEIILSINNYGAYFSFIKEHYMLIIALVAGIWCISSTVQNEIDIKRSLRLL